ncbi:MAG TPA: hypothetical protein PLL54_00795 [Dermatophilaceae bacterium]|nr:hypothetical protein [Dermatophilaceae bacterium]
MAFVSHYRRMDETDETVSYAYGWEPDELTEVLCLDKATRRLVVADGIPTHGMTATAAGVLRRLLSTGSWPDHGYVAS